MEVPTAGSSPIVPTKAGEKSTSHRLMFGVRLAGGNGFEFIVPYMTSPAGWCGADTCSKRSAIFGDLELTFAPTGGIEIVAGLRYGFEPNSLGEHDIVIRPGIIGYLDESSNFKIFLILQALIEITGRLNVGGAPGLGLQYDFMPYFGMFLQLQASFMALEVVRFEANASFGVQGRIGG